MSVKTAANDLQDTIDETGVTMTVEDSSGNSATISPRRPGAPQLSFDLGRANEPPDIALLKISGALVMHRQLDTRDQVHVQVADDDGEIVADGYLAITAVQFKDHFDEQGHPVGCERIHSASPAKNLE